ncbi:Acid phosphatase-like protein 2 [Gryganskiella cystojenkinii]|nr:Acid phosphatase-like protein 2 [Gryganskiella cystojenkinii]
MIIGSRFVAPLALVCITIAGLFISSSRLRSVPLADNIPLDILDQADGEDSNANEYNYCQAKRPNLKTYPAPKVAGSTLVHSQLFVRHGDRTPIMVLPLDLEQSWECNSTHAYFFTGVGNSETEKSPFQYANVVGQQVVSIPQKSPFAKTSMWKGSCIPGQLTPKGAHQHRLLGASLRQIYVDELKLLPSGYDPEAVQIRSTDIWRTKQSAENFMAGLYGIDGHSGVPPPVLQIHTLPVEIDYLTMNGAACPRLGQLRAAVEKGSEVLKDLERENVEFNKELISILGLQRPWSGYMDTIMPRVCHGMALQCNPIGDAGCITPETATRVLDNVNKLTTEVYRDADGVFDVLQLGIGPLATEIKENLLEAQARLSKIRFHFYSGHDTTITPLLGLLDSAGMRWPPYASNLLIELWSAPSHKKGGEHFVRVLYNHAVLDTRTEWCDMSWCPLETFVAHLEKFAVDDVATQCLRQ